VSTPRTGFAFLDEPVEKGVPLAFAHRGGALHPDLIGLENTLEAFRCATDLGYRYLETDVQTTSDGVLMVFHDDVLDRTTDQVGPILSRTRADLEGVVVGGRALVPTLESALEEFPDARFNIDLKSAACVEPMVALVDRMQVHDRICVGSFEERVLRRFRSRSRGRVVTSCGVLTVGALRFAPFARHLAPLLRDSGKALQVPHVYRGITYTDRRFVERAHAGGRQVHVWTIDDRDEMEYLLDLGVDGIISDRTDVLREVLIERGLWEGAS
jgi:glycerophosphoryl diester phosphodiesterase